MIKRAILRVSGQVQHVGYREAVERIASQLLILGTIQNLPDGRVEIICEGEEDVLKTFIKQIQIREEEEKPFLPRIWVENIEELWEEPSGEFTSFGRKYAEPREFLRDLADEMKIGRGVLISMAESLSNVAKGFTEFTKEMMNFRKETRNSFHMLGERYHVISIVSFALLISLSIIGIFGFLLYSNVLPRDPSTFFYIFIAYIVLWGGVIYFSVRYKSKKALKK